MRRAAGAALVRLVADELEGIAKRLRSLGDDTLADVALESPHAALEKRVEALERRVARNRATKGGAA